MRGKSAVALGWFQTCQKILPHNGVLPLSPQLRNNSFVDTIYLDHNATTPIHPEVVEAMRLCYAAGYANPASQHRPGQTARRVLEDAREQVAELLGANLSHPNPDRLLFTGGGTESNNLAVLGLCRTGGNVPGQLVISAMEHHSVIGPAEYLLEQGWRLDTMSVNPDGVVRAEQLAGLLGPETRLVSIMLANHETGVLQPVERLAAECEAAGIPMHTDAVQVAGKLPIDFRGLHVSALSVAAHKFRGPPAIGALLLRHDARLAPLTFGGHQQRGLRPGTEPVALAVGMATALKLWRREYEAHLKHLTELRDGLEAGLKRGRPDVVIHGQAAQRLPQTSNVAFPGLDGQMLLMALDLAGVACSVGSACDSGSTELSPTLRAMGLPNHLVRSSLRLSVGATNTIEQIDEAVCRILNVCRELASDVS
ncbi:MAG: cysteine desulfurase family protein [Thermoguttaceae bacterium]|jgi:cysteine desulfurase|nr:cysteine desulfurase family protein [Thermoguttaceae bacterium]